MANPKLRFCFREPTVDTNRPLTDGTVSIEGFELELVASEKEADVLDQGFGALVGMQANGAPVISIPAFPNRKFRQSYIQVNASAGITSPSDLEGRRVGINAWSNTAGIWARGALQNYYNVDLRTVRWLTTGGAVANLPEGVEVEPLPRSGEAADAMLDRMLTTGELDAVICPNVLKSVSARDPRVCRLFADYPAEEQEYFANTGIFPISHVVTFTADYVENHPEAPVALLEAYRRARDVAFDRIEGSDPDILTISWASYYMAQQRALMGEHYWAYNVDSNRTALGAMMEFAFQQRVTPSKLDYESFFDKGAAALPGY